VTVLLTSNAWTIYRHPVAGIITRRMIEPVVHLKGAECCKYRDYQFSRVFEGTNYASGTFTISEPHSHFMPCACLAKQGSRGGRDLFCPRYSAAQL